MKYLIVLSFANLYQSTKYYKSYFDSTTSIIDNLLEACPLQFANKTKKLPQELN